MAKEAGYSIAALARMAAGEWLPAAADAGLCGGLRRRPGGVGAALARGPRRRSSSVPAAHGEGAGGCALPRPGPFRTGDHARFLGRVRLTDHLTAPTAAHRCGMVLGPSGSGKSSLLHAGLIRRLRNTEDPALRPAAIRILT
ncbi:nSTAND1 domain-containing NTPase [Streptomyces sp. NPDC003032]